MKSEVLNMECLNYRIAGRGQNVLSRGRDFFETATTAEAEQLKAPRQPEVQSIDMWVTPRDHLIVPPGSTIHPPMAAVREERARLREDDVHDVHGEAVERGEELGDAAADVHVAQELAAAVEVRHHLVHVVVELRQELLVARERRADAGAADGLVPSAARRSVAATGLCTTGTRRRSVRWPVTDVVFLGRLYRLPTNTVFLNYVF